MVTSSGRGLTGGNRIQGNSIGTDADGEFDLANSGDGIFLDSANNLVGGPRQADGNTVAYNFGSGVRVGYYTATQGRDQNAILSNSIHSNLALGIDLAATARTPTTRSSTPTSAPTACRTGPR